MDKKERKIVVRKNGPYVVYGGIPLVRKVQVCSEYGEPLTWRKVETIPTGEVYTLCRCGHSRKKPFCDGSHAAAHFDGTETADTGPTAARQITYNEGTGIVVRSDPYLCMESGFCANRFVSFRELVPQSDDPEVRRQLMSMVDHCPSGSLTFALTEEDEDVEPDLPEQIAVTTEQTSEGPIAGPLWVTGNIPIERADGRPFETRNRVTLCRCGLSKIMPLCDGTHRHEHVVED
ncbi:MAG: iron-binding protein [Chloroflexi bacterium]|jgi:CDGSH-type Zn-finger protein|nr:iron-binding protein [Chloroflexota bacterium]